MKIIRIIQVGDIHYTDAENFRSPVDSKDGGFPASLISSIGMVPLTAVFRELSHAIQTRPPALIAFMGDFTNRGEEKGLNDSLTYVRGLFPPAWAPDNAPLCQIIFGNHDIDRRKDAETHQRFDDINAIISSHGFNPASVQDPEILAIGDAGGAEIKVYGINSCLGCGQTRLLGQLLAKQAGAEIARLIAEGGASEELNELDLHP